VFLGNDTIIGQGSSITLDAGIFENYEWSTGENSQLITVIESGDYSVFVSNSLGCMAGDTITILENLNLEAYTIGSNAVENNFAGTSGDISVYPNPNKGNFCISLPKENTDKYFSIVIYNTLGEVIYFEPNTNANTKTISLEGIQAGTYFVRITADNISKTSLIIIE